MGIGPQCRQRLNLGAYRTIVPHLMHEDDDLPRNRLGTFVNYFRMDRTSFDKLYNFVAPLISKQDTLFGLSIPAEERLMLTLRYLATGASFRDLFYTWKISTASISNIIFDTCMAIHQALTTDYVRVPRREDQWLQISDRFYKRWNFPNAGKLTRSCVG